jgi:hypothetical protein
MIWTSPRIGDRIESIIDAAWYVRDPDDGMGFSAGFELGTAPPPGATDTGYRWLGTQLWSVPDDPSASFLIYRDRTERWPRAEPQFCA